MVTVTLAELKPNDTFRYIGSDENDWHTVINTDDDKLYYPGYLKDKPESNHRVGNVRVILKDKNNVDRK